MFGIYCGVRFIYLAEYLQHADCRIDDALMTRRENPLLMKKSLSESRIPWRAQRGRIVVSFPLFDLYQDDLYQDFMAM